FSIHSTFFSPTHAVMAVCVIDESGTAPCQCLMPGGHQITSPAWISVIGPPHSWVRPLPAVTMSCWPAGCVCQADLAPGVKLTLAADGSPVRAGKSGVTVTAPVKN